MKILAEYKYDGFLHIEFDFKGKKAIAIMLEDVSKRNGKAVFKTEYFGAFPDLQNEFVRRGYTLIFLENRNRWGTDSEIDDQIEFIDYASQKLGISNKVITLGMSCGGMMSILIAAKSPEHIHGLYIDAPVVSFLSCPARLGDAPDVHDGMWQEFERAWGMTKRDLLTFTGHPYNKINELIKNKIIIYMAYGDSDKTVPYEENGIAIERAYKENRLEHLLHLDKKIGIDHHPHGPSSIDDAIKFFEN